MLLFEVALDLLQCSEDSSRCNRNRFDYNSTEGSSWDNNLDIHQAMGSFEVFEALGVVLGVPLALEHLSRVALAYSVQQESQLVCCSE